MAIKRMFSLRVVDTDTFLDMSPTAQNLYFHLGMRADDDGFVANPKKIMKICGAPDDDMKVLEAKGFVIRMATNGICVITHWKINNLIRVDRYTPTEYAEEKNNLIQEKNKWKNNVGMTNRIPSAAPELELELELELEKNTSTEVDVVSEKTKESNKQTQQVIDYFFEGIKNTRGYNPIIAGGDFKICKRFLMGHSVEQAKDVIDFFVADKTSLGCQSNGASISRAFSSLLVNKWKEKTQAFV